MKMEGGVLSVSSNNNRFRLRLKNAANALCARTLPKQRGSEPVSTTNGARHHTYPRTTPTKRSALSCRMEPLIYTLNQPAESFESSQQLHSDPQDTVTSKSFAKWKGTLAREVASAWECRVGQPDQPASADRIQSLFNDIELYPTKTQVFEMLVCARQCARRKSLTLTFGEFCVFAAELRRCSKQARQQTTNKPESPIWSADKEGLRVKDVSSKQVNGSEASPPPFEVFLGGSCNPTTWRSDIAIPMLKKMGITYFNPQVEDWSTELMEVEHRAKAAARALLFVLDSETRAVAASVEAAHLATAPRDLLLVLKPYSRHQTIGHEAISDHEYVELSRARATLQEAVERRGLPAFTDIPSALRCARAVLRGARTHPRHSLGHTILRLKRAYDAAGGRNTRLPRTKAVDVLKDVTRVPREVADRCVPSIPDTVDFETFCACVAELASDAEGGGSSVPAGAPGNVAGDVTMTTRIRRAFRTLRDMLTPPPPHTNESNSRLGLEARVQNTTARVEARAHEQAASMPRHMYNARLKAYGRKLGLIIPKNGGHVPSAGGGASGGECEGAAGAAPSGGSADSVFTPGTERRLERLPAMLGVPTHDVYLGGTFPFESVRPADVLRGEGLHVIEARANDYTRMFSSAGRRAAAPHPESPRHDKKPRQATPTDERVQFRERDTDDRERNDRLSASDFYKVTEDVTPQPFKGTYDEDLLLGSRVLVFAMCADSPCFAAMVLAAHYMGLRPTATILLVQLMDPKKAHNYSEAAIKDYNRGRHYLADLARRSNVPVFDNVDSVISCVISRLRPTL